MQPGSFGEDILDNPVWHALSTRQANLAEGDDHAKRFPARVTPIAAIVDQSPASYGSLVRLLRKDEIVGFLHGVPSVSRQA